MGASPMNETTNQYLEVDKCNIDNEIENIPVIDHGQIANKINKKEHQQTWCRATEYARNVELHGKHFVFENVFYKSVNHN